MQILKCKVNVDGAKRLRAKRVLCDFFHCDFPAAEKQFEGFDLEHEWWNSRTQQLFSELSDVGAELVILTPVDEIDTYEKHLSAAKQWLAEQDNPDQVMEYISLLMNGPTG